MCVILIIPVSLICLVKWIFTMTSQFRNNFNITGPLWVKFTLWEKSTSHPCIPFEKARYVVASIRKLLNKQQISRWWDALHSCYVTVMPGVSTSFAGPKPLSAWISCNSWRNRDQYVLRCSSLRISQRCDNFCLFLPLQWSYCLSLLAIWYWAIVPISPHIMVV